MSAPRHLTRQRILGIRWEETALRYQHHAASLDELEAACAAYLDAKRAPLARSTQQDHERKGRTGT